MPAQVSRPEITAVSRICSTLPAAASGQPIQNVVCAESSSHEPRRILAPPPTKQTCLHELLPCKLQVRASWRQENRDGQVGSPGL
jgi:hypothetical protein